MYLLPKRLKPFIYAKDISIYRMFLEHSTTMFNEPNNSA